jgi:protein-tyrosine phosphatase
VTAYWVDEGRFLAGPYPEDRAALPVDVVVDLTLLIPDFGCPSVDEMRAILTTIDTELADGRRVYVHCHAGIGRTGTVAACWLVEHGSDPEEALRLVTERRGTRSPETDEQWAFVRAWKPALSS